MKPRKGQQVQVKCDGRELVGKVFAEVTEPSVILQAPSGRLFLVPIAGSEFVTDVPEDDVPLREPPPEEG